MSRCDYTLVDIFRTYGLTYLDTLDFALQIAKGMQFLHHNRIIHRNLKITNILVRCIHKPSNVLWHRLSTKYM